MVPEDIKVGLTYRNRGAGRTRRKVIAIGSKHRPDTWYGDRSREPVKEVGVLYEQNGKRNKMYLRSFASWCGAVVAEETVCVRSCDRWCATSLNKAEYSDHVKTLCGHCVTLPLGVEVRRPTCQECLIAMRAEVQGS